MTVVCTVVNNYQLVNRSHMQSDNPGSNLGATDPCITPASINLWQSVDSGQPHMAQTTLRWFPAARRGFLIYRIRRQTNVQTLPFYVKVTYAVIIQWTLFCIYLDRFSYLYLYLYIYCQSIYDNFKGTLHIIYLIVHL